MDRLLRLALRICLATSMLASPACDYRVSRLQQDELRAELATFPAPDHLRFVHREEGGISSCIGGDCPWADRYYVSERSVEITCQDVRRAIDRWGVQDVDWHIGESELNPCTAGGTGGDRYLSVAVYDADRLLPSIASGIDRSELRRYRSAVSLSLGIPP
jgi:hypothetical protein